MRLVWILVALGGCAHSFHGPHNNELVSTDGRINRWATPIGAATYEGNGLVKVAFGKPAKVIVSIPTCYAHQAAKIGDHDKIGIELDGVAAKDGELDIDDCTTKHVVGKLWATFPDGQRLEALFDTDLTSR